MTEDTEQEVWVCQFCGTENPDGLDYCYACGMPLEGKIVCPKCGSENNAFSVRCSNCGKVFKEDMNPCLWTHKGYEIKIADAKLYILKTLTAISIACVFFMGLVVDPVCRRLGRGVTVSSHMFTVFTVLSVILFIHMLCMHHKKTKLFEDAIRSKKYNEDILDDVDAGTKECNDDELFEGFEGKK